MYFPPLYSSQHITVNTSFSCDEQHDAKLWAVQNLQILSAQGGVICDSFTGAVSVMNLANLSETVFSLFTLNYKQGIQSD